MVKIIAARKLFLLIVESPCRECHGAHHVALSVEPAVACAHRLMASRPIPRLLSNASLSEYADMNMNCVYEYAP